MDSLRAAFSGAHQQLFGVTGGDEPVEFVNFRVRVTGRAEKAWLPEQSAGPADAVAALKGYRPVYFRERGGPGPSPVYQRDDSAQHDVCPPGHRRSRVDHGCPAGLVAHSRPVRESSPSEDLTLNPEAGVALKFGLGQFRAGPIAFARSARRSSIRRRITAWRSAHSRSKAGELRRRASEDSPGPSVCRGSEAPPRSRPRHASALPIPPIRDRAAAASMRLSPSPRPLFTMP